MAQSFSQAPTRYLRLDASHHAALRLTGVKLGSMALIVFLLWWVTLPAAWHGIAGYAPLHTLAETLAIMVAGLIFAVGWNTRTGQVSGNAVLLACAFAGVALLDFSHLLSFPGMPDYVTPSNPEKTIAFWLTARLLAAVALLGIAIRPSQPLKSAATRYLLLIAVLGLVALVHWLVLFHLEQLPHTFIPGRGLTGVKIGMEYLIIALNLAAALALLWRMRHPLDFDAVALLGAVAAMAMSELLFTRYASLNDLHNLAGHAYKVISYLFLYQTVFVANIERPYRALDALQNRLTATLDALPDMIFEMDLAGRCYQYHQPAGAAVALTAEEILGCNVQQVLPAAAAQVVLQTLHEAQETGRSGGHELVLTLAGEPHWFELSAARKTSLPGEAARLIVLWHDITQHKLTKMDLRESQRSLQEAQQIAQIGHYAIDLGSGYWTSSAVVDGIFGIDAGFVKHIDPWRQLIIPAQRDGFLTSYRDAVSTDLPFEEIYQIVRPHDGQPRWISITGKRECDAAAVPVRLIGTVQDVTRRHESEQQLRLLETAVAGLNDILLITDADTIEEPGPRIVFVNDAFERHTGYRRDEVLGQSPRMLQGPKTQRNELDRIRAALSRQEPVRAEVINYTKDGAELWTEIDIMPMADARGRVSHYVAVQRDISARKALEQKLAESARHTQSILDNVVDAVITIDRSGTIASFNLAATSMFGYSPEEAIGQNVSILMPQPYRGEHASYMHNYHTTGIKRIIGIGREVQGEHKLGGTFPMSLSVSEIQRNGEPMYIGLVRDITQRHQAEAQIQRLAFYDQLTDLPNRRLLLDRMTRALPAGERSQQLGALIFIDLDHFKTLNDTWGHETGDQMLVQVANRLLKCVREGDTVARIGGDEFVVMLENLGKTPTAAAAATEIVAQTVLSVFASPFSLNGHEQQSSASLGITLFGDGKLSANELMGRADSAMYHAKSDGRDTYRFFDADLQAAMTIRAAMEDDLRQSLARSELHLAYQPQVDLHGAPLGAEALVRWTHPVRGNVSPAQFIPLAEHSGFILELGKWVLETACAQLAAWADTPDTAAMTMSVNVSARQFRHPLFVNQVLDTVAATGANPARLKLELTESMLVDDVESMIRTMALLKPHGIGFSLDDFGTGYSSLSYLKRLPLDQLKIDQSFVRDVLNNAHDASIARTVVALGNSLGLAVIAEGVETAGQRDFLEKNGCHTFQGYLFSRPLDAVQLAQFLERKAWRD